MDSEAFNVYTTFYVQCDNICYYLQQDLFHRMTEQSITQLLLSADYSREQLLSLGESLLHVTETLARSISMHQELKLLVSEHYEEVRSSFTGLQRLSQSVHEQVVAARREQTEMDRQTLQLATGIRDDVASARKEQEEMGRASLHLLGFVAESATAISETTLTSLKSLKTLSDAQDAMMNAVAGIAAVTTDSLAKQKILLQQQQQLSEVQAKMLENYKGIENMLTYITALQETVFGKIMDVYSILWYAAAVVVCIVVTSTSMTSCARGPLILALSATYTIERILTSVATTPEAIDTTSRLTRISFVVVVFGILSVAVRKHKDYALENNSMLKQLIERKKTKNDV